MMPQKIFSAPLFALALALFLLAAAPASADNGAKAKAAACPVAVGKAIDAADAPLFEKLVAVDAILADVLDVFLKEMTRPEVAAQMPPMLALVFSQAATGGAEDGVRRLLLSESRAFVINGVASGAFAGRKVSQQAQQGLLVPLFANASIGRKEICNVGEALPLGQQQWRVPFEVRDGGNDRTYPVIGRVGQQDGVFRLLAIENLQELVGIIRAEGME